MSRQRKCLPTSYLMNYRRTWFIERDTGLAQLHLKDCMGSVTSFPLKMPLPRSEAGALTRCPLWRRNCHSSMSSVTSRKLHLITLADGHTAREAVCSPGRCLQGLPKGTDAVVDVAFGPGMFVHETSNPLPWIAKSSSSSVALRLTWSVRCSASTLSLSWTARRLLTSLKAWKSWALVASCATQQSENFMVAALSSTLELSRSSYRRLFSFKVRSSSSSTSRVATCNTSPASCSCATLAMVTSKSTYSFASASSASTDF